MNRPRRIPAFALCAILLSAAAFQTAPAAANPSLSGPSGLITLPTPRPEGGLSVHEAGDARFIDLNLALVPELLEVGLCRDTRRDTNAWHAKLTLVTESGVFPALSVGAYGFSSADADASQYLVAGKSIPLVGGTVYAGVLKRGRMRSLAALSNYTNPIRVYQELSESERQAFFALEYPLLPLLSLMGESVGGTVNAGVRVSPVAGLVVDWNYLDVRDRRDFKDRRVLNVKYRFGF